MNRKPFKINLSINELQTLISSTRDAIEYTESLLDAYTRHGKLMPGCERDYAYWRKQIKQRIAVKNRLIKIRDATAQTKHS